MRNERLEQIFADHKILVIETILAMSRGSHNIRYLLYHVDQAKSHHGTSPASSNRSETGNK